MFRRVQFSLRAALLMFVVVGGVLSFFLRWTAKKPFLVCLDADVPGAEVYLGPKRVGVVPVVLDFSDVVEDLAFGGGVDHFGVQYDRKPPQRPMRYWFRVPAAVAFKYETFECEWGTGVMLGFNGTFVGAKAPCNKLVIRDCLLRAPPTIPIAVRAVGKARLSDCQMRVSLTISNDSDRTVNILTESIEGSVRAFPSLSPPSKFEIGKDWNQIEPHEHRVLLYDFDFGDFVFSKSSSSFGTPRWFKFNLTLPLGDAGEETVVSSNWLQVETY